MDFRKPKKKDLLTTVTVLAGITVFSFILANFKLYQYRGELFEYSYWNGQAKMLTRVYLWALLGIIVYRFHIKFPVEKNRWYRNLFIHFVICLIIASAHTVIYYFIAGLFSYYGSANRTGLFVTLYFNSIRYNILIYWLIFTFLTALDYYHKYRNEQDEKARAAVRAARLEARLAKAQLQVLKMQVHPHFLFNSLNTAVSLIRDNQSSRAIDMISKLGDFLRKTLDMSDRQYVSLREEIGFTEIYLDIEKIRFQERLVIKMNIDPLLLNKTVPFLIMQPIVENSVKHVLLRNTDTLELFISVYEKNGKLYFEISDNGQGFPEDFILSTSSGCGLKNIVERLETLYRGNFEFNLKNNSGGGANTAFIIPSVNFTGSK